MSTVVGSTNAYAANTAALATRLERMADQREGQAVAFGARLCRDRALTPLQVADALIPHWARVQRLRRSAAIAARTARELG